MKLLVFLYSLALVVGRTVAFAPSSIKQVAPSSISQTSFQRKPTLLGTNNENDTEDSPTSFSPSSSLAAATAAAAAVVGGLSTGLTTFATYAYAGEEIEMAELPPPWVPAIFAVVLLVGVGLLTGSLGNVIDEEAQLGLQSGARARKEIERSKSSYFKKR